MNTLLLTLYFATQLPLDTDSLCKLLKLKLEHEKGAKKFSFLPGQAGAMVSCSPPGQVIWVRCPIRQPEMTLGIITHK